MDQDPALILVGLASSVMATDVMCEKVLASLGCISMNEGGINEKISLYVHGAHVKNQLYHIIRSLDLTVLKFNSLLIIYLF